MKTVFRVGCLQRKVGALFFAFLASALFISTSHAAVFPTKLGDLDGDTNITVLDLVIIINHMQSTPRLSSEMAVFADVNQGRHRQ